MITFCLTAFRHKHNLRRSKRLQYHWNGGSIRRRKDVEQAPRVALATLFYVKGGFQ
jgi:hypothetical protein